MALNPVLVIKIVDGNSVGVRARLKDDYIEHEIVLNSKHLLIIGLMISRLL